MTHAGPLVATLVVALALAFAFGFAARLLRLPPLLGYIAAGMFLTTEKHFQEAGIARIPMKRAGTAEEVAQCIAFLGSPEASYVTGQTLFVCGGLSTGF